MCQGLNRCVGIWNIWFIRLFWLQWHLIIQQNQANLLTMTYQRLPGGYSSPGCFHLNSMLRWNVMLQIDKSQTNKSVIPSSSKKFCCRLLVEPTNENERIQTCGARLWWCREECFGEHYYLNHFESNNYILRCLPQGRGSAPWCRNMSTLFNANMPINVIFGTCLVFRGYSYRLHMAWYIYLLICEMTGPVTTWYAN